MPKLDQNVMAVAKMENHEVQSPEVNGQINRGAKVTRTKCNIPKRVKK